MSFITQKTLMCGFCQSKETIEERNFPEELHALLSKYRIPQIVWVCDSCALPKNLKYDSTNQLNIENEVQLLKRKVQELESRMNHHTNNIEFASEEVMQTVERGDINGYTSNVRNDNQNMDLYSSGDFLRSQSASPHSCSSFMSDDTTPKKKKEALEIIHAILNKKIKISDDESYKSSQTVTDFINHLTPALKKLDQVFNCLYQRDYKTGSSYNKLRISAASEYDINIVFKPPSEIALQVDFFKETHVFAKIKWIKGKELNESKSYLLKFFEKISEDGYINPVKVKSWFQSLVDSFILSKPTINGIKQIKSSQSGPARTVELVTTDGYVLNIDLMPVFIFTYDVVTETPMKEILEKYPVEKSKAFWHLVPKLCQGEEQLLANECKLTWRIDFPEVEKKVLYNKQCAKNVIKILKLLRDKENWKSIASYHLKTLILLEVDENPDVGYWSGKVLFDRFLEAMKHLRGCLQNNHLPYFLCAKYNLFHLLKKDQCKNISDRLGRLISSIESDPTYLKEYFLSP